MATFMCSRCHRAKPIKKEVGTGYATNTKGKLLCYACCADIDRAAMIAEGKATLYLTCEPAHFAKLPSGRKSECTITNWPGTLTFPGHSRYGRHNWAGVRYDVWFTGPNGEPWWGVTYGDRNQLCHCKRITNK